MDETDRNSQLNLQSGSLKSTDLIEKQFGQTSLEFFLDIGCVLQNFAITDEELFKAETAF